MNIIFGVIYLIFESLNSNWDFLSSIFSFTVWLQRKKIFQIIIDCEPLVLSIKNFMYSLLLMVKILSKLGILVFLSTLEDFSIKILKSYIIDWFFLTLIYIAWLIYKRMIELFSLYKLFGTCLTLCIVVHFLSSLLVRLHVIFGEGRRWVAL